MGTITLIEGFMDVRNLMTLTTYTLIGSLTWIAINSENRQRASVLILVSFQSNFCILINIMFLCSLSPNRALHL